MADIAIELYCLIGLQILCVLFVDRNFTTDGKRNLKSPKFRELADVTSLSVLPIM